MNFGKNLQYLRRLNKNITQEDLAEKMNVSRQTISKWETDEAMPEMEKAFELCKIFNCTLDNLFRDNVIYMYNILYHCTIILILHLPSPIIQL